MSDIKQDLQNVYDSIAKDFSKTRHIPWEELSVFIPYLPDGGKILDLGCGNGRLLKVIQSAGKKYEYLGVDFSDKLLEQARQLFPDEHFEQADMARLNFPENSFDVICLIASFHHLDNKKEREDLLNNIYRWLKPGGVLFMTNWNLLQPKYFKYIVKNIKHKIPRLRLSPPAGESRLRPFGLELRAERSGQAAWNDFFIPYTPTHGYGRHWRYYHHFTKSELQSLLLKSGFKLEPLGLYKSKYNLNCLVKK